MIDPEYEHTLRTRARRNDLELVKSPEPAAAGLYRLIGNGVTDDMTLHEVQEYLEALDSA